MQGLPKSSTEGITKNPEKIHFYLEVVPNIKIKNVGLCQLMDFISFTETRVKKKKKDAKAIFNFYLHITNCAGQRQQKDLI